MNTSFKKFVFAGTLAIAGLLSIPSAYAAVAQSQTTNQVPTFTTYAATNVSQTQATLNGAFTGNGININVVRFEYGITSALTSNTVYQTKNAPSGNFSETISITPGQMYYFRAMGVDANGNPGYGTTLYFSSSTYSLPTAYTYAQTNVTSSTATLNGGYVSSTSATTYFEYANNSSFIGSYTTAGTSQSSGSGNFSTAINVTSGSTYYFRAMVTNSAGTTKGNPLSFTASTGGGSSNQCLINYFYASPSNINIGNTTTIYYSTSNCTSVSISNYGAVSNGSGSFTTNALYGNTSYTITASSSVNTAPAQTLTVTTNQNGGGSNCYINYFYASPSSVSYGGNANLFYSTTNCSNVSISNVNSSYSNNTSGSVLTGAIYSTTTFTITAYSSYGYSAQTQSLTVTVNSNNPQPCTYNCYPNTCTYNCYPNPQPNPTPNPQIIYINNGSNFSGDTVTTTSDVATLSIASQFSEVYPDDFYSYVIKYQNITSGSLDNANLSVELPREVHIVGHSTGIISGNGNSITVSLGTLSPKESGSLTIDVQADSILSKNSSLFATATLTATKRSTGATTTTSASTFTRVKNGTRGSSLAGLALFGGDGFLPQTFGGWIVLFALLGVVVFVGRHMYKEQKKKTLRHTINPYDVPGHN